MRPEGTKRAAVGLFIVVAIVGLALAASAVTVSVKTNGGDVIQGTLSGLAQVLRLADPTPAVGPAAQFDIPLDSIQGMWVDFPRVVIETVDRVLVAPYSAFTGVAQLLRVDQIGSVTEIPFTAIRQIAFGDVGFRDLPREWLGQSWLNQRMYVVNKTLPTPTGTLTASTTTASESAAVETEPTTADTNQVVWNGAAPAAPATTSSTSGQIPWWVLLLGVAALILVFFLIPSGK